MSDPVQMTLHVDTCGVARCVYGESIDLHELGTPHITRASYVEPDGNGRWSADMSPGGGPRLGPFPARSEAIAAERRWLDHHWPLDQTHPVRKGDLKP